MYLYNRNRVSKPVLAGRSIHNTRIERLWRDVHRVVGSRFKNIFESLEHSGELDLDNSLDLWILHAIFLPIISRCLKEFQVSWDFHRSTNAQGKTPLQQYVEGLALRPDVEGVVAPVPDNYAIDPEERQPVELAAQEEECEEDEDEDLNSTNHTSMEDMIWLENSADEAASQRQEIQVPIWELPEGMQDHIQELVSQYQPPSFADGDDTVGISC